MKKLIFILTLSIISLKTYSQDESKLHFGLKVAPSFAWLRSDTSYLQSDGSKIGFSYGLMTEFKIAKNYAFVTGIDITYRGGKFKTEDKMNSAIAGDSVITTSNSYNLEYIEIPITLKFKTNEIGYLTYYLQAGVAPGVNIRARRSFTSKTQVNNGAITETSGDGIDYQKSINNFNLSMIIGAGIEYTLSGSTVILAGLQFNNGFMDVFDGPPKVNSNFLALTVGILF